MPEKNRAEAWSLLTEFTQSESLLKHGLAVETAMRHFARKLEANEETWGMVGLLHDFDYERWPDPPDHPLKGEAILKERGWPEEITWAITTHADYLDRPRETPLQKYLFACDELCGFLTACALVQPSKSIHEVQVRSVKKKLKSKGFARSVHREDIYKGVEEIGSNLEDHIQEVLDALCQNAEALGLSGDAKQNEA